MKLTRLFNLGLALIIIVSISGCMHRGYKTHGGKGKSHATFNDPASPSMKHIEPNLL